MAGQLSSHYWIIGSHKGLPKIFEEYKYMLEIKCTFDALRMILKSDSSYIIFLFILNPIQYIYVRHINSVKNIYAERVQSVRVEEMIPQDR